MADMKRLLSIVELGGYPDFSDIYLAEGFEPLTVTSVRKAIQQIKKQPPQVIVAEFNFQSDFRDRTSNLESLLAAVERLENIRVVVFYEQEFGHQFQRLQQNYPIHRALAFPIDTAELKAVITELAQA